MNAALLTDGVDWDDVLVLQMGRRQCLVLEALQMGRIEGGRERQHFQGDAPVQRDLLGLVHHAHAAAADFAQQAKITELTRRPSSPFGAPPSIAAGSGGWKRPQRRSEALDGVMAAEEVLQLCFKIGMGGQELMPLWHPPGLGLLDVAEQDCACKPLAHAVCQCMRIVRSSRLVPGVQPHCR